MLWQRLLKILLVNVVRELVVASQGNKCSQTQAVREEDLCHGVDPHLGLPQLRQVWRDVELDAFHGAGQGDATNQQDGEKDVREQSSEIHDLIRNLKVKLSVFTICDKVDEQRQSITFPVHLTPFQMQK